MEANKRDINVIIMGQTFCLNLNLMKLYNALRLNNFRKSVNDLEYNS